MNDPTHLSALRSACASAHAELEDCLDLLSSGLTLERYVHTLALLGGHYRALEPLILPHDDAGFSYTYKHQWLESDLTHFGAKALDAEIESESVSRAAAFGIAYVLEGASLGGRVIAPHVQRTLQLGKAGTRYFRGSDQDTTRAWNRYRLALSSFLDGSPGEASRVHSSAIATFDAMNKSAKAHLSCSS